LQIERFIGPMAEAGSDSEDVAVGRQHQLDLQGKARHRVAGPDKQAIL
jgi:hypothetical protein